MRRRLTDCLGIHPEDIEKEFRRIKAKVSW
jgi:hypothetical protein